MSKRKKPTADEKLCAGMEATMKRIKLDKAKRQQDETRRELAKERRWEMKNTSNIDPWRGYGVVDRTYICATLFEQHVYSDYSVCGTDLAEEALKLVDALWAFYNKAGERYL